MSFTLVRDQIVIGEALKKHIEEKSLPDGGEIKLIARQIRHEPGFVLRLEQLLLSRYQIVIIAHEYNSNGGAIDVSGVTGFAGAVGSTGSEGYASTTIGNNRSGGPGGSGGVGGRGTDANTVNIICNILHGARLIARGGTGGVGGEGGRGGNGGNGRRVNRPIDPEIIEGTSGGSGGSGGNGGNGGNGGQVSIYYVTAVTAPLLEVTGGAGGVGGQGGSKGRRGNLSPDDDGRAGSPGAPGLLGAAGQAIASQVSIDSYWSSLRGLYIAQRIGWANHRLAVGEYYYRAYNPEIAERNEYLRLAMQEFNAVIRLVPSSFPSYAQAIKFKDQILLNINILGLPNDLDLLPRFDLYVSKFTATGTFIFTDFNGNINILLAAQATGERKNQLELQKVSISNDIATIQSDLQDAVLNQQNAEKDVQDVQGRITETNNRIRSALNQMNNSNFSIFELGEEIAGTVGTIGSAVVGLAAVLPTGGASLIALAPSVVALVDTAIDDAPTIVSTLFKKSNARDEVEKAYKKVNQDVDNIVGAGKSLINFVNLIDQLASGKTPENSQYVSLVQQGLELTHSLLLAQNRKEQAIRTVQAVQAKLDRAQALLMKAQQLIDDLSENEELLRKIGLAGIRNLQSHLDSLLDLGFRAQRSAEIYSLQSFGKYLRLDAGYVHPDVDRDYTEGYLKGPQLIGFYTQSFGDLLKPIDMQRRYEQVFSNNNLDQDILPLSFTDPNMLQNVRDTRILQFNIDLRDLPSTHFYAKIQGVFVAFVGATSPSGFISCEVRHGNRYLQKRLEDNKEAVQILEQQTKEIQARTARLELGGVDFQSSPPLTAPQSLPFWGRGVAGLWDVFIPQRENNLPDLTELSEIQVWVGYQFLR